MLQDLQRSNAARESEREGKEGAEEERDNGRRLGGRGSFVFEIANGIVRELWMNRRGMSRNFTHCEIQPSIQPIIHLSSSSFINPSSYQVDEWMDECHIFSKCSLTVSPSLFFPSSFKLELFLG
jgi:hypothetical protein